MNEIRTELDIIRWFNRSERNKLLNNIFGNVEIIYLHPSYTLLNVVFKNDLNFKTVFREII